MRVSAKSGYTENIKVCFLIRIFVSQKFSEPITRALSLKDSGNIQFRMEPVTVRKSMLSSVAKLPVSGGRVFSEYCHPLKS
jgi:hypothetical protein